MFRLCDRPLTRNVNFETSRFVASTARGMNLGDQILEMGDEVPKGALDARALRLAYDVNRIETFERCLQLDYMREACARRGVRLEPEPVVTVSQPSKKKGGR